MLKYVWRSVLVTGLSVFFLPLSAQVELNDAFRRKLDQTGLFFMEPLEGRYKAIKRIDNPFQPYDFAIRSRPEKMEIRYLIEPWKENNPLSAVPNVRAARLVMHLASNQGEGMIIGQHIGQETLLDDFNADWGKVFFFEPKDRFSTRRECKLLVLHKEGIGTAYIFFLYDKISTELDRRFLALQFK